METNKCKLSGILYPPDVYKHDIRDDGMKIKITIISACVFALFIFSAAAYYVSAFNTLNTLIHYSNITVGMINTDLISAENFDKLSGIHHKGKLYINSGGTFAVPAKISLHNISFQCTSNYSVVNFAANTEVEKVSNRRFFVDMRFVDWKWRVEQVELLT